MTCTWDGPHYCSCHDEAPNLRARLAQAEQERNRWEARARKGDVALETVEAERAQAVAEGAEILKLLQAIKEYGHDHFGGQSCGCGHYFRAALGVAPFAAAHSRQDAEREARVAQLTEALEWIAHFDDAHMATAMTLHHDMRGMARAALATQARAKGQEADDPPPFGAPLGQPMTHEQRAAIFRERFTGEPAEWSCACGWSGNGLTAPLHVAGCSGPLSMVDEGRQE